MDAGSDVAFVTGAGSGIGRAVAVAQAEAGRSVALFDLSPEGIKETASLIHESGGTTLELPGDVTKEEEVVSAFASTAESLGHPQAVAACAGIDVTGAIPDMPVEDWHRVVAVNLTGVFNTARHAIRSMREAGSGSFVAISSDGGVQGCTDWAAYCATKHGVIGLIRCLALDHGPEGIRANAVCPALTDTPMADRVLASSPDAAAARADWEKLVPLGRLATPEDVAAAVTFLTSDSSTYLSGQSIGVDGGATAGYFQ